MEEELYFEGIVESVDDFDRYIRIMIKNIEIRAYKGKKSICLLLDTM